MDSFGDIRIERELATIVLGALTNIEELAKSSTRLMDYYGVIHEPQPTLVEIARETQSLAISIDDISEELRDQRVRSILKKIAMIVPVEDLSNDTDESENGAASDSIGDRLSSLGE